MKILSWEEFAFPAAKTRYAITVGVFDGVHTGHRRLLGRVLSRSPRLVPTVVTFRQNPKKILHPQSYRGCLSDTAEKLRQFEAAGVDRCVLIDFSQDFGTLSGGDFLAGLAAAGTEYICIGPNFRCGHKMDTNAQALETICRGLGIEVEIVEPVTYAGHPVSSSRIRNAVLEGKLAEARAMLGRPYSVAVRPEEEPEGGDCVLKIDGEAVLPPDGLYRVGFSEGETGADGEARLEGGFATVCGKCGHRSEKMFIFDMISRE